MAKKGARNRFPARSESGHEIWIETNTTNNRVAGVKKITLSKYDPKVRKHVKFTQAKRPANVQQGGKKKH